MYCDTIFPIPVSQQHNPKMFFCPSPTIHISSLWCTRKYKYIINLLFMKHFQSFNKNLHPAAAISLGYPKTQTLKNLTFLNTDGDAFAFYRQLLWTSSFLYSAWGRVSLNDKQYHFGVKQFMLNPTLSTTTVCEVQVRGAACIRAFCIYILATE